MLKIVAIGGGEIGRPGHPIETIPLDKEIIRLSGKKNPRVLFLPTASSDANLYVDVFKEHYGKRLGCPVEVLYLFKGKPSLAAIKKQISSADIVYVGGGNTLKMMRTWRRFGVDQALLLAAKKGAVLSGVSAGAICWFQHGQSDSLAYTKPGSPFIRVRGLDLVNILLCPHFDKEIARRPALKKMLKNKPLVAIGLDNCAALEIVNDSYRLITSKKTAGAYKASWKNGKYRLIRLPKKTKYSPLRELQEI